MNAITPITVPVAADPFRITGPAVISVSGGRTSAYMLWRILEAHGGALPPDVVACFANTGRELEPTLRFVARCASAWNVKVHWLEYCRTPKGPAVVEVSHNSASRAGEPFRLLLQAKGYLLPHPKMRYCTEELKVKTLARWLRRELGWTRWTNVVGLRADEPERLATRRASNAAGKSRWHSVMPLAEAGVTKPEVLAFFRAHPFDLELREWEGNCGGCFAKRIHQIARMFEEHPAHMAQWVEDEAESAARGYHGRYRSDRPSLAAIAGLVRDQARLPFEPENPRAACGVECG